MKVLIVGAGIGGLTTALALQAQGLDVQVVEAVSVLKPLGVGINVLPHAVGVLSGLGLAEDLATTAIATKEIALFNRHGQSVWSDGRGLMRVIPSRNTPSTGANCRCCCIAPRVRVCLKGRFASGRR